MMLLQVIAWVIWTHWVNFKLSQFRLMDTKIVWWRYFCFLIMRSTHRAKVPWHHDILVKIFLVLHIKDKLKEVLHKAIFHEVYWLEQKINADSNSNWDSHYLLLFYSTIKIMGCIELTKTFESRSPSEFPPLEVGNSNLWIIWLSVEFGILFCKWWLGTKFIEGLVFAELL